MLLAKTSAIAFLQMRFIQYFQLDTKNRTKVRATAADNTGEGGLHYEPTFER